MVFSSAIFLFVFLPVVFILYRLVPSLKIKNLLLALASIVFYAFGQLRYVPLFLLSVLINYLAGLMLQSRIERRKLILTLAVVLNVGILGVFKYTDFMIGNLNALFALSLPLSGIELPIGISFFTFQGLSYTIDVYRDRESGTKNFLKLLLYISFFPQLIAGPIVKYHDIAEQIDNRSTTPEETGIGLRRFITGLAKKILIANAIGYIADRVFNDYLPGGITDWQVMWLGAICYTLQIYYDFSGYSDMAIGIGHMFGFSFRENFRYPYGAVSIKDFWRKWHISLSSWFKEYLYIPLGGNRKGKLRTILNKMIVFFCTGIWHGANWTFVLWGFGHGLLSSLEDLGVIPAKKLEASRFGRLIGRAYTLLAVMLLFVVFRADSISQALKMIALMFGAGSDAYGAYLFRSLLTPAACAVLLLSVLFAGNLPVRLKALLGERETPAVQILVDLFFLLVYVLCLMSLARGGFNPFIYFQF
ncbi:MAG: MBOAT family protein [Oscillospiraceae bacterium]|nr:MBOAT family protein [Oscillospiraceae bacterium]